MQHYTYPAPVQPAAEQKKPPVVVNVLSIVSLAISAVASLLSIAFLILTNTTVSNGDSVGVEMVGYVSGFMIFMLGSLALAFVGGISGFVMTIITLVVRNFRMVWIPVVSMIASIVACSVTCAVL